MKFLKCSNDFISYRVVYLEEYEFIRITNEKSYSYYITSKNDNKKIKIRNKLILLEEFIPKNEDKILTIKFFDCGTIMKNFVGDLNFITHEFIINSNYSGDIYSILKYFIDNKVLNYENYRIYRFF